MAKTNFQQAAKELKALQGALRAVGEHTKRVSRELVGGLESAVLNEIDVFQHDVQRRLDDSVGKIQGLSDFLAGLGGSAASKAGRKPGRPAAGGPRKRKKNKRGVRVNLTKAEIEEALAAAGGVKTKAAELLGISVPTFNKQIKATGVSAPGGRRGRKPASGAKPAKKKAAKKATARKKAGTKKKKATKKK